MRSPNPPRAAAPRRWHVNQDRLDIAIALAITTFAFVVAFAQHVKLDPVSIALILGQTLPVAIRRRQPHRVLMITGCSIGLYSGLGYPDVGGSIGVLIAFYSVATHTSRRATAIAAGWCAVGITLTVANYSSIYPQAMADLFPAYLEFLIAWLVGDYVRVRRLYIAELEARAERLEREREERARQAVFEERGRIARELHDVVAHHVSVMVVQTAAAQRILDADPALAHEALDSVEEAGRTALAEMRRTLEVLRTNEAKLTPQPRLEELQGLADQVRDAGVPVELDIEGERRDLPAGLDLAVYRIVQEALTNVVKHAGPSARAEVRVAFQPQLLEVTIEDNGRGAAAQICEPGGRETGHGLIGMRERVALYGGTLEVGPLVTGGYRVCARLPLAPAETNAARRSTLSGDGATADTSRGEPARLQQPASERP